jgi:hypothetical protein
MNNIVYQLFPTIITETVYPDNTNFVNTFYENWSDHFNNGMFGEISGRNAVHHQKEFSGLFSFLTNSVQQYLTTVGIDYQSFDINFIKSWINAYTGEEMRLHHHSDAHLSVVYYVSTPEDEEHYLCFRESDTKREAFDGISVFNSTEWNQYGAKVWSFDTNQGHAFVFPSRISHFTHRKDQTRRDECDINGIDDLKKRRICIASDILLTYSDVTTKQLGIQPVEHWRKFH